MQPSSAVAFVTALATLTLAGCASAPAPTWDGLELVERRGLDLV